jgi:hypothetical protein
MYFYCVRREFITLLIDVLFFPFTHIWLITKKYKIFTFCKKYSFVISYCLMVCVKKIWCSCSVCQAWDGRVSGRWECQKIECACEEKVYLVTWENDGVIYARYVCADKRWGTDKSPCGYFCGFDVDAFEDCLKYYMIIKAAQYYIFYMLYRDKC